ncbi:MAG: alanyl-tRNA editing protein [Caldilineae bacterium]|nr:MAG: alanyl-tRNA editing protein [Caldilineae bacterium]
MKPTPTQKLYWADAYRRTFTAQVLKCESGERPGVVLNRTLFYPTGGGQPHDTGRLGSARVIDVRQIDDVIVHYLDREPEPTPELCGTIDWPRRWDHMQQHSGQHLLSAAFVELLDRPTIGFHLGEETVTIDLPGPMPSQEEVDRVLDFVQAVIAEDRPVVSYQVDAEEAAALPLRKAPTVSDLVRVVEIEDLDWSACGGTHVRSTGAIGSLVITRLERRGSNVRVHFLCGGRSHADHRRRLQVTQALCDLLTTGVSELPASVAKLQEERSTLQRTLRQARSELLALQAVQMLSSATTVGGVRIVRHILDGDDPQALNQLLRALTDGGRCVALLAWSGERPRWLVGRSADVAVDLTALQQVVRSVDGIKGGGRGDLLQGGAADLAAIETLLSRLEEQVRRLLAENPA